jgi:hypothetical protein
MNIPSAKAQRLISIAQVGCSDSIQIAMLYHMLDGSTVPLDRVEGSAELLRFEQGLSVDVFKTQAPQLAPCLTNSSKAKFALVEVNYLEEPDRGKKYQAIWRKDSNNQVVLATWYCLNAQGCYVNAVHKFSSIYAQKEKELGR